MGMTINSHFCGKRLSSVSLTKKGCCCKKSSKMPKGCCKNEVVKVKITDIFSPSTAASVEKSFSSAVVLHSSYQLPVIGLVSYSLYSNHSPPLLFADRVVAFHSFLI
jgi:hypothetical protein